MKRERNSSFFTTSLSILLILFSVQAQGIAQDKAVKIDEFMKLWQETGEFNGTVLVAEKGKVIFKKGYGFANLEWNIPNKPDTKFRIGSITKQFTSMLIMQLVEKGKIDLQGKLSDYLPYYRKDIGEKVTIHHLLTHTSGIPSYTRNMSQLEEIHRDPYPADEFVEKYCSDDLEFEPGSKYRYNNSGYFILGAVIEAVTGKPYADVLQIKILEPLGMKDTGYDLPVPVIKNRAAGYSINLDGYENAAYLNMSLPYAAGALYSTVEDLYKWDQALYTDKLLSKKMKDVMFKPHVATGDGAHYAYGWVVSARSFPKSKEKVKSIAHGGGINGFNTLIERLVDDKHFVAIFNNTPAASLNAMSEGIIRILFGKPYTSPKKSISQAVYDILLEKGVEEAVIQYRELKKNRKKEYNFQPRELNRLGYHLLFRRKMVKEAIEIFKLNIEVYPKYANGYDSLAEGYMVNGDKELAIKYYAKSLEMNPNNTNAVDKLNELMKMK
ncbi:MAG: serine hydrolase [Candidatus Aminicenantaceae bacterium]